MSDTTRRVATGAGWLYGHRWIERLLDLLAVVVLARLLPPGDFGLVAIAASFVAIVEGLAAFDVDKALIRTRDDDPALYDSAWTLSMLRGLVSAILMAAVAPLSGDSQATVVVYVLAVGPLLAGMANPTFVTFERELLYSRLAILTVGAKLVSVGITLVVAVLYRSYWALVLGMIAGTLVTTILTYAYRPYRPRISFARFSDIFAFSGWLSLATVSTTLAMQTDRLIVGRLLGVRETGFYYVTTRIGALPTAELVSPLQRLLYPSFSEIVHDPARLRRAVAESINVLGSLSIPAGCGFALVANDFVPLALGDQWRPIVPLLLVLAPYLGFRATLSMAQACAMALGRTRLLAMVCVAYMLVHIPVFVVGTAWFGLSGAIWSIVLAGVLYSGLNAWMLTRTVGLRPREMVRQLERPLGATACMVAGVMGLHAVTPLDLFTPAGSWLALGVKIAAGGVLFCGAQFTLWHLQGRPAGIERRLLQITSRSPALPPAGPAAG